MIVIGYYSSSDGLRPRRVRVGVLKSLSLASLAILALRARTHILGPLPQNVRSDFKNAVIGSLRSHEQ